MGYKTLEVTLISAKDLKNVKLIGKMDVYVVVYLSGEPRSKQKTPVDQDGGTNPKWNYTMRFTVDEAAAQHGWMLIFQLKHEHSLGTDKDLGEVHVPLKDLFGGAANSKGAAQFVTYQVKRTSGKPKGELSLSYKLTDAGGNSTMSGGNEQNVGATAYPPPYSGSSSSAPPYNQPAVAYPYPPPHGYPPPPPPVGYPQQPSAGYPHPAPVAYGGNPPPQGYPQGYPPYGRYPPQASGYGYPPPGGYMMPQQQQQQQQKPQKSGFGMGLGAGLLGGAIGGLLIGEVVSDAHEDGYDAGFDDGGGFDF